MFHSRSSARAAELDPSAPISHSYRLLIERGTVETGCSPATDDWLASLRIWSDALIAMAKAGGHQAEAIQVYDSWTGMPGMRVALVHMDGKAHVPPPFAPRGRRVRWKPSR